MLCDLVEQYKEFAHLLVVNIDNEDDEGTSDNGDESDEVDGDDERDEGEKINTRLRSFEIIISSILSYFILHTKIYRHHYVTLVIIVLLLGIMHWEVESIGILVMMLLLVV